MARLPELRALRRRARAQDDHDRRPDRLPPAHASGFVERVAETDLPTAFGELPGDRLPRRADGRHATARRPLGACGDVAADDGPTLLVRVHSECLTGDVVRTRLRCDCGAQLRRRAEDDRRRGPRRARSTCARRGAASAWPTSCAPTSCRTTGPTPSRPTSCSASRPTCATTASAPRSSLDLGVRRLRLLTNNPRKVVGAQGLRHRGRRARPAARRREPLQRGLPGDEAGEAGALRGLTTGGASRKPGAGAARAGPRSFLASSPQGQVPKVIDPLTAW